MKKLLALLSTVLLGISLTACGKMEDKKDDVTSDTQASTQAPGAAGGEQPKQQ